MNSGLKITSVKIVCAHVALAAGVTISGCDAPTQKPNQVAAEPEDPRFGPWKSGEPVVVNQYGVPRPPKPDAPKPAVSPQFDTTPQGPRKELIEFAAEVDNACQSARKTAALADPRSGSLSPGSVSGRLATREGFTCLIMHDERSVSDMVSGGPTQSLGRMTAVLQTESPHDVRAVVCVDESATKIGTYVMEKGAVAGARQGQAFQLVWDARLLSWPSRRVIARREFRGDVPPFRILGGGNVCGGRPWRALNEWLERGGEKRPPECDAQSSHKQSGFALAISPDGRLLLSASVDGDVKVWALPEGTLLRKIPGHRPAALGARAALAISADGKLLASSSSDDRIELWTFPEGKPVKDWSIADKADPVSVHAQVSALEFSPDGTFVASLETGFGGIKLWSVPDGKLLKAVKPPPMESTVVLAMAISPDGKLLASGGYDQIISVRELPRGFLKALRGHTYWVQAIAISRDGKLLASASERDHIRLWGLPDGSAVKSLPQRDVRALAIHPDGTMLASAGATLKLWDTNGTLRKTLWGHGPAQPGRSSMVDALVFSPDGRLLASGGNNSVRLWSLPEGRLKACLTDRVEASETTRN